MDQIKPACQNFRYCFLNFGVSIDHSMGLDCVHTQTHVNVAILLTHNVDQNWVGPVVCHLKAIKGESRQVKPCQS